VFLCNDGATANEAALKIARKHGRAIDPSGGKLEVGDLRIANLTIRLMQ
jgi:acetylornithine aminotransferase